MPIVIDAAIAIDWFTQSPSAASDRALDAVAKHGAIVPALWRWEVQDVLRRLDAAGKLTTSVDFIRLELRELPIEIDGGLSGLFGSEGRLSQEYNLSVYDAAYLELALRLHVPLATTDRALGSSAQAAGLPDVSEA